MIFRIEKNKKINTINTNHQSIVSANLLVAVVCFYLVEVEKNLFSRYTLFIELFFESC